MPYTVSVDERHRLVEVVYSGRITTSTRVCAMEDGATLLDKRQYTRVLVDLRAAVAASDPPEGNSFAMRMSHQPRVRGSRLAYVTLPQQHGNLLLETMAAARHLSVQHFHERGAALAWLLLEP
jgi:hypothetical protein